MRLSWTITAARPGPTARCIMGRGRRGKFAALAAALVLAACGLARDDKGNKLVATDPAKAGPDFAVQGEYAGEGENVGPVGLQLVAEGGGKFKAVAYPGG